MPSPPKTVTNSICCPLLAFNVRVYDWSKNREDDTTTGSSPRDMRTTHVCVHTHQGCNLQNAFGRDTRWFVLLSYWSLPQRTEKMRTTYICVHTHQGCNLQHAFGRDTRWFVLLFLLVSSTKNRKKPHRLLSNFGTTASYIILVCVVLAQHRVLYWETWPRLK